jgi:hypothetical protein
MIHLFDKVYVTYAEKFVGPQDESRLPESFLRIIDRGISFVEDRNYDKHLLTSGKNLSEVIEKFGTENDMFIKFKEIIDYKVSPKFIIFCDENAMLEILIRWWKFVFPNIESDGAFCLYKNFSESQTMRGIRDSSFLNVSFNSGQTDFSSFSSLYWSENKEIFKDKFNKYPAFNLDNSFKKTACVEFQIMNYLVTGLLDKDLEKKLKDFFNKSLIDEITSIIEDCQDNIYSFDNSDEIYFSEDEGASKLLNNSVYKIILDKNIKKNSDSFKYLCENYELLKVSKDLLNINSKLGSNKDISNFDYPCLHYIVEKGLELNVSEFLESQIKNFDNFNVFNNLIHKNRLNSYLVPAFRNRIKIKGKDALINQFKF